MAERFDLRKRIGAGHFGEVWQSTETALNAERAVKLIQPSKVLNQNNFFHEAQILKAVEHPNIVRVVDAGTMADGRIYVAMEYLRNGSLEDERQGSYVDLTRAKQVMIDMLRGLQHAHTKNILHRDIKPGNILIGRSREGQLSDFGLAIPAGANLSSLGAKDYAYALHQAPEIIAGKPNTTASDIYACGVTLYRILNGDEYFAQPPAHLVEQLIRSGKFPDRKRYRDFVPLSLRRLVNKALEVDPKKRFASADEMRHALERISIARSWKERRLSSGTEWMSEQPGKVIRVQLSQDVSSGWRIDVWSGSKIASLRHVNNLCHRHLTKAKATSITKRILQDFASGKRR